MTRRLRIPAFVYRLLRYPPRLAYALGLGPIVGRLVLLLTTTGRRTGRPRVTPLQFEETAGLLYVLSARGLHADRVRNLKTHPEAEVRLRRQRFPVTGDLIHDPGQIADVLALRLAHRPRMMRALLRAEGLPFPPGRADLEALATEIVMVSLRRRGYRTSTICRSQPGPDARRHSCDRIRFGVLGALCAPHTPKIALPASWRAPRSRQNRSCPAAIRCRSARCDSPVAALCVR